VVVLDVQGGFTGSLLDDFETEVTDAIASGFHLVVNLSATSYIGPDALGCLTYLLGYARSRRREMWLTGLRPLLIRVIRAARLGSLFRTAPRVSDALRRLEPEAAAIRLQVDEGWISLHLDGQLIPLPRQEALTVHRQLQQVFDESLHSDQIDSVA
jgi:anti-anti-sigma factor